MVSKSYHSYQTGHVRKSPAFTHIDTLLITVYHYNMVKKNCLTHNEGEPSCVVAILLTNGSTDRWTDDISMAKTKNVSVTLKPLKPSSIICQILKTLSRKLSLLWQYSAPPDLHFISTTALLWLKIKIHTKSNSCTLLIVFTTKKPLQSSWKHAKRLCPRQFSSSNQFLDKPAAFSWINGKANSTLWIHRKIVN